jgi:hypothetical protein
MVAVSMKHEKAMRSALVTLGYWPARYCRIWYSPRRKTKAGMRWE